MWVSSYSTSVHVPICTVRWECSCNMVVVYCACGRSAVAVRLLHICTYVRPCTNILVYRIFPVNPYPASHTKIVGISTMLRDHDFFQSLRSHDQKKYGAGFLRNAAFRTCIESWGSPVKVLAESKVEVGELKYFFTFLKIDSLSSPLSLEGFFCHGCSGFWRTWETTK